MTWITSDDPTPSTKYLQFSFMEETIITGLIVTTHREFCLRRFRVRAISNLGNQDAMNTSPQLLPVRVVSKGKGKGQGGFCMFFLATEHV